MMQHFLTRSPDCVFREECYRVCHGPSNNFFIGNSVYQLPTRSGIFIDSSVTKILYLWYSVNLSLLEFENSSDKLLFCCSGYNVS
jgi:hypothetical protein